MRTKNAVLNMIFTLLKQLVVALSGLILPRLMIGQYGSEANGMIGSITQFLSYIMLMEAGVGGVINASLYKPLHEKDMHKVSGVLAAAKQFYRKIGLMSIIYIITLCVVYPTVVKSSYSTPYIVLLIIILAVGTLMQYFVSLPYISLIKSSQRLWVLSLITIIVQVLTLIFSALLIYADASIHVVKCAACIVGLLTPLLVTLYVHKHYVLPKTAPDNDAIKQRWNGLGHHIAYFIHLNTDIAIITLFMDLSHVSIYMVYHSIVAAIQSLIIAVSDSCSAAFGDLLAEGDDEKTNHNFDRFEFVQTSLTTVLYTITVIMLVPFVRIYTKGIHDADYIQPLFATIIVLAEAVYCVRLIYSTVLLSANKYKETQGHAWAEAGINIVLSVLLVKPLGLIGIAIGTLAGMTARGILDARFLSRKILRRPLCKSGKNIFVSVGVAVVSILCCKLIPIAPQSLIMWIFMAACVSVIVFLIAAAIYSVFYKDQVRDILAVAKKMIKR